ncbi:T9SS type A sorting domain-containing protein, partial [Aureisphaera sp.]
LATVVSLYTHLQDGSGELGIQNLGAFDESMTVPMGFSTLIDTDTEYKISISNIEGPQLTESEVYLVDNLTGAMHNLKSDSYSFTSDNGTFDNRFTIYFSGQVLGSENNIEDSILLYPNPVNDELSIFSMNSYINSIEVFDIRGRRMKQDIEEEKNSCTLNVSSLETAVYFVRVVTESGSVTKKIIKR